MEHPIPQNVTSFEFKLVGDMTLKQFLYLCVGIAIAYIAFIALLEPYPFIAWPIIIFSASLGAAFAFLPIADRPLDYWLLAFLNAIYSPTSRQWVKNKKTASLYPQFKNRMELYVNQPSSKSNTTPANPAANNQSSSILGSPQMQTPPSPSLIKASPPEITLPSTEELTKTVELARQAQALQARIIQTERELNQIKITPPPTSAQSEAYTEQVNQVLENMQKLVVEASAIKQQLAKTTHQPEMSKPMTPPVKVNVVPAPKPKVNQLVLTTFPNVINGVIADAQNNYLEGVVVVIYDKEGLPVRALKTNKLGQFSGATPLPNGTYTLQLEKDTLVFDVVQIELEGNVLPPILIVAKGGNG